MKSEEIYTKAKINQALISIEVHALNRELCDDDIDYHLDRILDHWKEFDLFLDKKISKFLQGDSSNAF